MEFVDYLSHKKIDATAFRSANTVMYLSFEKEFQEMHPDSFTSRKLYQINAIRRKYPLKNQEDSKPVESVAKPKPKIPIKK